MTLLGINLTAPRCCRTQIIRIQLSPPPLPTGRCQARKRKIHNRFCPRTKRMDALVNPKKKKKMSRSVVPYRGKQRGSRSRRRTWVPSASEPARAPVETRAAARSHRTRECACAADSRLSPTVFAAECERSSAMKRSPGASERRSPTDGRTEAGERTPQESGRVSNRSLAQPRRGRNRLVQWAVEKAHFLSLPPPLHPSLSQHEH